MTKNAKAAAREASRRRSELVPQLAEYRDLGTVFWPLVTSASRPNATGTVVNTDSRGHRVTRVDGETARSDAAGDGAAFLLGSSFSFGVGASDDSQTIAAELWRRTGVPYVNLAVRAGTSTQELIAALPFADRRTTFVVCSGLNNLAAAGLDYFLAERGRRVDPLFGPMYDEGHIHTLTGFAIPRLARLADDPVGALGDGALRSELRKRRRARLRRRLRPVRRLAKRIRGRFARRLAPARARLPADMPEEQFDEVVAEAATRQLRDLRHLRRLVPGEARVVFGLQPTAWATTKEWSPEEVELFDVLDQIQPLRWKRLKHLLDTRWTSYAAMLEQGCSEGGVPFVDLSRGEYSGWCFVDRIHMTDRGYETAAAVLEEVLTDAAR